MNKKLNIALLGVLAVFLIISTASAASATYLDDHIAGVGTMAHPTSNTGIAVCATCHATLGSPTTSGVSTGCHSYPVFALKVTPNPTAVTTGSATAETITVYRSDNVNVTNITAADGAAVTLSGAGVSTSGTTNSAGIYATSVNPTSAGTINAVATLTGFNDGTAAITVTTPAPVLTTITVTPATATLVQGNTQGFTASPKDQYGNPIAAAITWTSSNVTVGTIDASGNFNALAAGSTTITAANGTVSGSASVTVTALGETPVLTTITVSPATANLSVGRTKSFVAITLDQFNQAISAIISWASSNTSVGTIDSNGKFTALSAGTTTITATNGTISGTAAITVSSSHKGDHKGHKNNYEEDNHKLVQNKVNKQKGVKTEIEDENENEDD
ncbi:Bacterial Ig-like domain (group 2) [uncultured archaeon]|nr:Bacterial Ig-like domain (group 2) [uncultured archaeon]